MNVNFNNLRKQAAYCYDDLCRQLNSSIYKDDEPVEFPNGHYHSRKGCVMIDADEIQKTMDNLRMYIMSAACTYREGDDTFKDVSEEIGDIAWFRPENDDE